MQDQKNNNDPALSDEDFDDLDDMMIDDELNEEFSESYDPGSGDSVLGDDDTAYLDNDFVDDDDWEEGEFEVPASDAGAQKPKMKGLNMSFNTAVILGAVVVGFGVLVWQVVTKKPQMMDSFATALTMAGVETPVFGEEKPGEETPPASEAANNETGILEQPSDGPPMPAPVTPPEAMSPEEQAGLPEQQEPPLTPMPEAAPELDANGNPVPRSPDQSPPSPNYVIDGRMDDTDTAAADASNKAEDMLKSAIAARTGENSADAFGEDAPAPVAPAIETPPPAPTPETVAEAPVPPPAAPVVPEAVTPPAPEAPAPVAPEAPVPAPAASTASPELEQKIDILLTRLGDMENRINEINQASDARINTVREEIKNEISAIAKNTPPDSSSAAPADNTAVTQEIAAVREEMKTALSQIQEEIKKAPALSSAATPPSSDAKDEEIAAMRKEMEALREEVKKAPTQSSSETAAAPAPKQAQQPKKVAPKRAASTGAPWQLKAAKPGKAWVARAGDSNIRGVGVGDTLDGVGRITTISFVSGRWVVKGTAGQIVQ